MLKLIRNVLGDWKVLFDSDGNKIEWKYIVSLAFLQETEGLRGGNKLRLNHVRYFKMKMKVNLAAQTLSQSVVDTLECCMNDLKLPQFHGFEATIRFIRFIDILFDFLNSRNPYGQGYKAPLRRENEHVWRSRIEQILIYISTLKNENGELLFKTRRKMGFLGMYVAAQAVIAIFDNYVKPNNCELQYLLTYKFSQDHLELFFCAIRACGGWCPNPHCAQFSSAYKRLVIHHEIESSNGNVEMQDNTKILTVSSSTQRMARLNRYHPAVYNEMANLRVCKKYLLGNELLCDQSFNNVASLDIL